MGIFEVKLLTRDGAAGGWGGEEHLWVELPPILIPDGLDKGRGGGGSTAEGAKAQSAQMFQPVTILERIVPNPNKPRIL